MGDMFIDCDILTLVWQIQKGGFQRGADRVEDYKCTLCSRELIADSQNEGQTESAR